MNCGATVWRVADRYNLRRVILTYASGKCTRMGREKRGKLRLCAVHARMLDEGLVKEDGDTADPGSRRDLRRARKQRGRR